MFTLLVFASIVLITPLTFVDMLKPLAKDVDKGVFADTPFENLMIEMLTPLMMLIFNFALIPILIDVTAALTDHQTKSGK
jgi:hypothetical protein